MLTWISASRVSAISWHGMVYRDGTRTVGWMLLSAGDVRMSRPKGSLGGGCWQEAIRACISDGKLHRLVPPRAPKSYRVAALRAAHTLQQRGELGIVRLPSGGRLVVYVGLPAVVDTFDADVKRLADEDAYRLFVSRHLGKRITG